MFDIGFSEILVIAIVALIVIGPERLPKVARTLGHLFGRMQRYVNDVRADITREMELDELRKLQGSVEEAARSIQSSVEKEMRDAKSEIDEAVKAVNPAPDYPEIQPAPEPAPAPSLPEPAPQPAAQQLDLALDSNSPPPVQKQQA
jgi:sec-independent protein translocase protein TatB